MDLSPVTTSQTFVDEKRWLASKHGTDCMFSVTLDIAGGTFDDYFVPAGDGTTRAYIPSGLAIEKGAGDLWQVNATGGASGGHLFEAVNIRVDSTGAAITDKAGASCFWHGRVNTEQVPNTDFAVATDAAKHILYS